MRIVHVFQRDDPATGGALRVAEALAKAQSARGLVVWILFLYGPPAKVSAQFEEGQVICLGLRSSRDAWRGIQALRKTIRSLAPDIIHSHDGIVWPRLALYRIGIPIVMHAHLPAWNPHSVREKIGWGLISKTTDFLIGISRHTIGTWEKAEFPPAKIQYIPNGVDFERFQMVDPEKKVRLRRSLGLPESKKILLWIGQMHRSMKGTDRMEHVAARLPADTIMLAVGNGPEFCGIQQRCKPLLESGRLVMTGTVPEPAPYYMASDAFLFTSYHEPFGLVILEAVACGLPIMAFPLTQGGGAADLLSEFRAVQVDDGIGEREIGIALSELESRTKDSRELRAAAGAKYDWRILSDKVVQVYRSILGCQSLRVLVCQHGARHRYAIPRMLEAAGVLAAFYTDSSRASLMGKCIAILGAAGVPQLEKFSGRDIQGVPQKKVFSSDCSRYPELCQRLMKSGKTGIQLYMQRHRYLSATMRKWGLRGANVVYSMYYENLDFIQWAKQQGAQSAVDVYVSPLTDEIMEKESRAFVDWGGGPGQEERRIKKKLWKQTAELADVLICPSEWVAEGVRAATPWAASKIRVVPYGCSIDYQGQVNKPVVGRVLFAGRDPLRKGLHYLAQAASSLKTSIENLDVRVAGRLPENVVEDPICKDLNFIGQLDGNRMKEEFLSADVFVLPALSEGFAGVVAEAIGAGCPVVVTKETGSPVVNEREGLVIPSRNTDALAKAITRLVLDRDFRDQCSGNCLEQVPFYSENRWAERLLDVLQECGEA
ncbi:glycosyltransferase family 4 protein [Pontiella sp.]|uniref:glycosyltransferase family 4 protein n=1 Tax=Pontiella sp. TaxID=2837462 RepID=UPI003566FB58